jgi:hypothetical protein
MKTAQHPLIHLLDSLDVLCSAQKREEIMNYTLWPFGSGHVTMWPPIFHDTIKMHDLVFIGCVAQQAQRRHTASKGWIFENALLIASPCFHSRNNVIR